MNVYVCAVLRRYLEEHDKNPDLDRNETLGHFVQSHGYSRLFQGRVDLAAASRRGANSSPS